jgi:excisionase family DNA binding protein
MKTDPTRLALRPEEVAVALGIGKNRAFALINSGVIPSLVIGERRFVPVRLLEKWLEEQALGNQQIQSSQ